MKQLTTLQYTLLELLSDGSCHTGSELGTQLGISRSAIWKHINQLQKAGILLERLPQQGYKLSNPTILLDKNTIETALTNQTFSNPLSMHLFKTIDSTNRFLKELPKTATIELCCAEQQTQGRGRFSRHWHSPFGENIYCSTRWHLHCDLNKLSGLSLVTSLATLALLKELVPAAEVKVKWPNDILWNDKKLCGSLIEIQAESNGSAQVIIGIGLNVNSDTAKNPLPDKAWCSLYEISNQHFDRNLLIARLITKLDTYLQRFISDGLAIFMDEWHEADYLADKQITISQSTSNMTGTARGIDAHGQLILEDTLGVRHHLSSGDTTLST